MSEELLFQTSARRRWYERQFQREPKPAYTSLAFGMLFPLLDGDAELCVTMVNRAMTPEEWDSYARSPAAMRKRKPMSLRERASIEAEGGRMSEETMRELAQSGEMRVQL